MVQTKRQAWVDVERCEWAQVREGWIGELVTHVKANSEDSEKNVWKGTITMIHLFSKYL